LLRRGGGRVWRGRSCRCEWMWNLSVRIVRTLGMCAWVASVLILYGKSLAVHWQGRCLHAISIEGIFRGLSSIRELCIACSSSVACIRFEKSLHTIVPSSLTRSYDMHGAAYSYTPPFCSTHPCLDPGPSANTAEHRVSWQKVTLTRRRCDREGDLLLAGATCSSRFSHSASPSEMTTLFAIQFRRGRQPLSGPA